MLTALPLKSPLCSFIPKWHRMNNVGCSDVDLGQPDIELRKFAMIYESCWNCCQLV